MINIWHNDVVFLHRCDQGSGGVKELLEAKRPNGKTGGEVATSVFVRHRLVSLKLCPPIEVRHPQPLEPQRHSDCSVTRLHQPLHLTPSVYAYRLSPSFHNIHFPTLHLTLGHRTRPHIYVVPSASLPLYSTTSVLLPRYAFPHQQPTPLVDEERV